MFNSYTEEFKKNAVAVVKTGYGVTNLAKRLNVPPSSIRNWLDHPKYSGVEPADEKLLAMIPAEQTESHGLVQITDDNAFYVTLRWFDPTFGVHTSDADNCETFEDILDSADIEEYDE